MIGNGKKAKKLLQVFLDVPLSLSLYSSALARKPPSVLAVLFFGVLSLPNINK